MSKKRTYQDVVKCFTDEKCVLLTTEEEFNQMNTKTPKYKYIASCNHEHIVYFHVFLNRKTGVICPNCVVLKNSKRIQQDMSIDKIKYLKQELNCIDYFINLTKEHFIMKKGFDCCTADIIMKPIHCEKDEWVGIQVKTCKKPRRDYGFHMERDYTNTLVLCICETNKKMWGIPYNIVSHQIKLTIGLNKSKYNKYELTDENIFEKLHETYNSLEKNTYEKLDTPINIYQQREKEYRIFREEKINFFNFDNNGMEGIVYDFKIGDKKIQEKVGGLDLHRKNNYHFTLVKNGKINNQRKHVQYEKGDNDFYWLNCNNKKHFYLLPEEVLIEKEFIGNNTTKKILRVNPLDDKSSWLKPYLFDYDNINKELLCSIMKIKN